MSSGGGGLFLLLPSSPWLCFSVFPSVRVRQAEVNATANVGAAAVLACDADGFPDPVITWMQ